jgi:hypothetical protein
MAKDEFKGYARRFDKAGDIVKELIGEHACPECGDGTRGLYTQQWRKGDVPKRTLYHIFGKCPKGHQLERYGYGEAVK